MWGAAVAGPTAIAAMTAFDQAGERLLSVHATGLAAKAVEDGKSVGGPGLVGNELEDRAGTVVAAAGRRAEEIAGGVYDETRLGKRPVGVPNRSPPGPMVRPAAGVAPSLAFPNTPGQESNARQKLWRVTSEYAVFFSFGINSKNGTEPARPPEVLGRAEKIASAIDH